MNTSFIVQAVLFATGAILPALTLLTGRARRVVIAHAAAHAVGFLPIGLFHGSPDGPGERRLRTAGCAAVERVPVAGVSANALVVGTVAQP
ncbi:hypothetical protein [Streptomyces hokutonensis]|uniref:hypothetical protein n=1 Tax=Streptomyces hokutonensis TaxID=1306990 RepID=UPI0036858C83